MRECLNLMRHRGPDRSGWRQWRNSSGANVHLLFTRLSIIDLDERASQPFHAGTKWMVYNGELYNFIELREELRGRGVEFSTESDTEVMLRAIDLFGWEVLDRCEGMWAFAVYDERTGTLVLCRDRFGEKPLYLYRDETGLYFGSEVKFVRALYGARLTVNREQLYRYMVNGYKSLYKRRATFFEGLTEVAPSTLLFVDPRGKTFERMYWEPEFLQDENMSYSDAVSGAREKLIRAVRLRLRADVPLAFCMSGGVDSNSLIAIAKKICGYDVHGFTVLNSDARYEEKELVESAVAELEIRHTYIPLRTENFLDNLRVLICHHDAPVYTITYYAHWQVMKSVAGHGYRISISGTAADELFSGYYDHHLAYLFDVSGDTAHHRASRHAWEREIKPWVRNPYLGDPDLFVNNRQFRDHIFLNASDFAEFLKSQWREEFQEKDYTTSLLRNRMLNELFHEATPVILHEDDLNAMYYSIENRSPFLDRELFDFCCRVPTRHLVRNGRAKAVLRDAMRGLVPQAIVDSPRKVGFNVPIRSFLDLKDKGIRESLLDSSPVFDHVRKDKVEKLISKDVHLNSESKFLFYFLNCKIFLEEFGSS